VNAPAGPQVFIGLGANLGDAAQTLREALQALRAQPGIVLVAVSPLYRSAPVDAAGPDFFNAVAELRTGLSPEALLQVLQAVERQHGRERPYRNAPRTLDLDLLLHGDERRDTPVLTLPHPRMHLRAFVLRPLADLAPGLCLPGHGAIEDALARCAGQAIERLPGDDWSSTP